MLKGACAGSRVAGSGHVMMADTMLERAGRRPMGMPLHVDVESCWPLVSGRPEQKLMKLASSLRRCLLADAHWAPPLAEPCGLAADSHLRRRLPGFDALRAPL